MVRAALVLLLLLLPPSAADAGKRVALVIGNSAYQYAGELPNPRNDASDMAAGLRRHRFQVIERTRSGQVGLGTKNPRFRRGA
jgi:uncharacterized caspase-like protein